jgi:hypothetical protein
LVLQKTAVAVAYAKPGKGLVKLNGEHLIGYYSGVVKSSKQQPATVSSGCTRQARLNSSHKADVLDADVDQQAGGQGAAAEGRHSSFSSTSSSRAAWMRRSEASDKETLEALQYTQATAARRTALAALDIAN